MTRRKHRPLPPRPKRGLSKVEKIQVKAIVNGTSETKRYTTAAGIASVDFSGGISGSMCPMAQGDGYNQREGDMVTLSKATIRLTVTSAATTNVVRVILFRWKEDDTTPPTVGDILEGGYSGTADAPRAMLKFGTAREKYNVLWDKSYGLSNNSNESRHLVKSFYFKNSKVRYNAGLTTARGSLRLLIISDDGISTYPTAAWSWELYYKDL